ncbi:MAG: DUF6265 family protein [Steroidobacteraceae bacterium]
MNRSFIPLLTMLFSTVPWPAAAADCAALADLRWLLGDWTAVGDKSSFHESWAELGPQTFVGSGIERSKTDGAVKGSEALHLLEMAGEVFYISKVAHNDLPVAFRLTGCEQGRFVFENPAHDFPRVLEYRREGGDRLVVRVSDGGKNGFTLDFRHETPGTDPGTAVLAAEDARFAAMIAGDAEAMRRALAADLEYVHSTAVVESRDELIASITSGRTRYVAVTGLERQVVMLGPGTALVRGTGRFEVVAGTAPLDLKLRYLAVYGREEGSWRLRSWQSLRLP